MVVSAAQIYGTALFAIVMTYYGSLYFLWLIKSKLYWLWMKFIGVAAWEFPFLDITNVLAWGDCHHAGVDVFRMNPCDPLNRLFNYSPVLLDLPIHWLGVRNAATVGLTIDLAFVAMLPLLLRPDSPRALAISVLACLSPAVAFALERAHPDVFEITLIAAGALYATRGATQRLVSYAVYLAAGLLKFYPLVLLGLIVRERPRIALVCGGAAAAIIIALTALHWDALTKALAQQPPTTYFGDMFGAVLLPFGIARLLRLPPAIGWVMYAALLVEMMLIAVHLARSLTSDLSAIDWNRSDLSLLAVGSVLTVGCFVAGASAGYRVSILLFVIPGLLQLQCLVRDRGMRLVISCTLGAVLCCLWRQFFERGLINLGLVRIDSLSGLLFLLLRETLWWGLISVLSAFIVIYIRHSPLWKAWGVAGTRA